MIKNVLGRELIFISQINRDGSGTTPVKEDYLEMLQSEKFDVTRMSLSENTFIASGFNSFVVKVKNKLSDSHKGYIMPQSQKDKISKANKGNKFNAEQRRNMGIPKLGERNPAAKMSLEKAQEIRKLKKEGATMKQLALQYGVVKSTIEDIIYNKRWLS